MTTPSDRKSSAAEQATLFDLPPVDQPGPAAPAGVGRPRLRRANRVQVVYRALPLDALLPADHSARAIWAYVQGLDLATLDDAVASVHGGSGRAATDPRILLALWLYATSDGVGSARQLDRLCRDHVAYQWIAGDVPMNYHTLADFRTDHVELLDGLLTRSIATLMAEGLIDLNRVAQDGMRVRASAGAASFRRRPTLAEALAQAEAQVETLRAEAEGDPAAADRRRKAARDAPATRPSGSSRRWTACRSWRPRRRPTRRTRRDARRPIRRPP